MGNAASSVPYGAQSNTAHISLTCDYNPTGYALYDTTISLTAPLSAGAGQDISITDFSAKLILPAEYLIRILDSNAASYSVNTSITVYATNAQPTTFDIFPRFVINEYNTHNNVSYTGPSNLQIDIPASGETSNGVLAPIGPITLGGPGQTDIKLQSVEFQTQAYTSTGLPISPVPFKISCSMERDSPYTLASIVVDNSPVGPLLAPANNAPVNAPPTSLGQHSTTASIPVNCTENTINPTRNTFNYAFNYTFSATAPLLPMSGVPFNLTNVNNYLTVPGYIAYYSTALYGPGTCGLFVRLVSQDGLPGLGISFANAAPGTIDASNTFIASDGSTPNPLVTGRYVDCINQSPVVFPLPNLGHLDITGIVASKQNGSSSFSVSFDEIQGNIEGDNAYYGYAGSENWICTPLVKPILLSAPIS